MAKYFKCFTDKNPLSYSLGEEIAFTVFAREDGKNINCDLVEWTLEGDDGEKIKGIATITESEPLTVTYSLKRAGFVHLNCVALEKNGEKTVDFEPLDASAGADVLNLRYSDTLPEDFYEYWSQIENIVSETEIEVLEFNEISDDVPEGFKAYDVKIKTPEGRPASGCVTMPCGDKKYPIRVKFMGYGIHGAFCEYHDDTLFAMFNAHGFENDKTDAELEEIYGEELSQYGFSKEENAYNTKTYFRNMIIRDLVGLKYLKTLPEWNKKEILSIGGSQGALQAVTVAVYDKDVTELIALKPWFCDLNSVNHGYMKGWRPEYAEGLRYFDTVAQAMQVKCPTTIECYLGDTCCPPKTVMAMYNSLKCEKKIKFIQSARHSYFPPENEEVETIF